MTSTTDMIPTDQIFGPYSEWPRRSSVPTKSTPRVRRVVAALSGAAALGVFVHCGLPMLV